MSLRYFLQATNPSGNHGMTILSCGGILSYPEPVAHIMEFTNLYVFAFIVNLFAN